MDSLKAKGIRNAKKRKCTNATDMRLSDQMQEVRKNNKYPSLEAVQEVSSKKQKPLRLLEASDLEDEEDIEAKVKETRPGIIYLSRIPPKMTAARLREILQGYGAVGRIFLQPRRKKGNPGGGSSGGQGRRRGARSQRYTEGWVEFRRKKVAKRVASGLNNTPVGGKRHSVSYDSLWNMKYLHKFTWSHLTERVAYENAVREQRMRTELAQARREAKLYVSQVEAGQRVAHARRRKLAAAERAQGGAAGGVEVERGSGGDEGGSCVGRVDRIEGSGGLSCGGPVVGGGGGSGGSGGGGPLEEAGCGTSGGGSGRGGVAGVWKEFDRPRMHRQTQPIGEVTKTEDGDLGMTSPRKKKKTKQKSVKEENVNLSLLAKVFAKKSAVDSD